MEHYEYTWYDIFKMYYDFYIHCGYSPEAADIRAEIDTNEHIGVGP